MRASGLKPAFIEAKTPTEAIMPSTIVTAAVSGETEAD
jgi:hypothetical protein